jgi:hypothetical protein
MIKRSVPTRILCVIAAALFVLAASGEAFGSARSCPHHEAGVPSAGEPAAGHHAGHGQDEGAGGHAPCSCLGSCTIATPVAIPTAAGESVLTSPEPRQRIQPVPVRPASVRPIDHRLPFPNAPPLV